MPVDKHVRDELRRRLWEERPSRYLQAQRMVIDRIRAYLEAIFKTPEGEAHSRVNGRPKSFDDIIKKVDRPGRHSSPLNITTIGDLENDIRDIAAVRAVVDLLTHVDEVEDFIFHPSNQNVWEVKKVEDFIHPPWMTPRRSDTDYRMSGPSDRGYRSRHFDLIVFNVPPFGHAVWVELQIRTQNQSMWANLTTPLIYKTLDAGIDPYIFTQMRMLSDLLYNADQTAALLESAIFQGRGQLTPKRKNLFAGAGVPLEFLARLPHIVAKVQYRSCFICYGEPDRSFAERLCSELKEKGVRYWIYHNDATPGEPIWREIGRKRREADKMVVLCSAKALIRDGTLKEIEEQIDDDPDKMVPVSLDSLWNEPGFRVMRGSRDLKPLLLERTYADFSDPSRYQESLEKLLRGLELRP